MYKDKKLSKDKKLELFYNKCSHKQSLKHSLDMLDCTLFDNGKILRLSVFGILAVSISFISSTALNDMFVAATRLFVVTLYTLFIGKLLFKAGAIKQEKKKIEDELLNAQIEVAVLESLLLLEDNLNIRK